MACGEAANRAGIYGSPWLQWKFGGLSHRGYDEGMTAKRSGLRWAVLIFLSILIVPASALAQMYRWVDERGSVHYSEGIDSVPPRYRSQAQEMPYQKLAPAPEAPQKEPLPKGSAKVSFEPGAQILVKAMVNGRGPLTLILDTGADSTVIAPLALWKVGVSTMYAPRGEIQGATGRATVGVVQVDSLEIGDARVGPLTVIAHDVELPAGDGLLGRDFLSHFNVTVDSKAGIVTLAPK